MTRHVVRTFERVLEVRIVLWHESLQPSLKVAPRGVVRVFHDNEARAGVATEHRHDALAQPAACELALDLGGEFVGALAGGAQRERGLMESHGKGGSPSNVKGKRQRTTGVPRSAVPREVHQPALAPGARAPGRVIARGSSAASSVAASSSRRSSTIARRVRPVAWASFATAAAAS